MISLNKTTNESETHRLDALLAAVRTAVWLKPIVLSVALVLVFVVTFVLYPRTEEGTYWRELTVAAIGSLLTIVGAVAVALVSFRKQLRKRKESRVVRNFSEDTWNRTKVRVGQMTIDDVVVVQSSTHHREWTDIASVHWESLGAEGYRDRIVGNDVLLAERKRIIRQQEELANREGYPFFNDLCVDLINARIDLVLDESNNRHRQYTLTPALGNYYDFFSTGNSLDDPVIVDGAETTLRKIWNANPTSITDVSRLPCIAKIGTGTVVVTKDNKIVLGVRGKTAIAGRSSKENIAEVRKLIHFVGEGMIPSDLDSTGRINPRETSARGLWEELAIGEMRDSIGKITELRDTGFFFDQKRYQPCFSFLARIDMTWDDLQSAVTARAKDGWEFEQFLATSFNPANAELLRLLRGTHPTLKLASNHAAAYLWFACIYEFGFFPMRDYLSIPLYGGDELENG